MITSCHHKRGISLNFDYLFVENRYFYAAILIYNNKVITILLKYIYFTFELWTQNPPIILFGFINVFFIGVNRQSIKLRNPRNLLNGKLEN